MREIAHISTPYSEPWVAWTLLLLLLILVVDRSVLLNITECFRAIFSHTDRIYSSSNSNGWMGVLAVVYRVMVLSLTLYLLVYSGVDGAFSVLNYLKVMGVVTVVFIVREAAIALVGWVFIDPQQVSVMHEQGSIIRNLACVFLWVVVLLMTNLDNPLALHIICCVVLTLFLVMMFGKGVQMFYKGVVSLLYIILYFISIEIVPLCGAVFLTKNILG